MSQDVFGELCLQLICEQFAWCEPVIGKEIMKDAMVVFPVCFEFVRLAGYGYMRDGAGHQ